MFNAGSVYYMDDKGRCSQCFTADGAVKFLLYSEGRDMIVVVTEGLILSQHRVAHDGTTSEVAKVRAGNKFSHHSMFNYQQRRVILYQTDLLSFYPLFFFFIMLHVYIWRYYNSASWFS